jgi:hypothetical protein
MGRTPGVSTAQRAALARLSPLAGELGLHLVGGTAIAVHLGHRRSLDLDLFSIGPGLDLEHVRTKLIAIRDTEIVEVGTAVLHAIVDRTPLDVVAYPYSDSTAIARTRRCGDLESRRLRGGPRRPV